MIISWHAAVISVTFFEMSLWPRLDTHISTREYFEKNFSLLKSVIILLCYSRARLYASYNVIWNVTRVNELLALTRYSSQSFVKLVAPSQTLVNIAVQNVLIISLFLYYESVSSTLQISHMNID